MKPLFIQGVGAVTCVGLDAERTVASLRSGLDGFAELPFWGEAEQDLQAAPVRGFAEGVSGIARYEALAMKALVPALGELSRGPEPVLFVGLPRRQRPGAPAGLASELAGRLARRLGLGASSVRTLEHGRTSVHHALRDAAQVCAQGRPCVVGGVDCLVNPRSLKGLSSAHLLKEEWDGFIPGEAAAFIGLSHEGGAGPWGRPAAAIVGLGLATEPADGSAAQPLVGVGVRQAYRAAAEDAGISDAAIDLCINDVNGARAAFEDESYGWARFFRSQRPAAFLEVWHLASYLGETGAAVGALSLLWGAAALELGFREGKHFLISASEGDARAALVLAAGKAPAPKLGVRARTRPATTQVSVGYLLVHPAEPAARSVFSEDPGLALALIDDRERSLLKQNFDALSALITIIKAHHELGEDPWEDLLSFEDRLLAHVDALGWGGQRARELALIAVRSPEPEEVAAGALTLLMFGDDSGFRDLIVEATQLGDEHIDWICEVARYAPAESAGPLLTQLLERPAFAARALDALRVAALLRPEHVRRVRDQDADPQLAGALIRALGFLLAPADYERARFLLGRHAANLDREALIAALAIAPSGADLLRAAGIVSFAHAPLVWTFARMRDASVPAPPWDDGAAFQSEEALLALGWSGEPRALPLLQRALESDDATLAEAAARALRMIEGSLPAAQPQPAPSAGKRAAANAPEPVSARRLGKPLSKDSARETLQAPEFGSATRRLAHWQHLIQTRSNTLPHPLQFVRIQRAQATYG